VEPPKVDTAEVVILERDQIVRLLKHVKARTLHPILMLALATEARRGELLALRMRDFDPAKGTIRIERSLERTKAGQKPQNQAW
jgi:integrase